jgi:4-aminobutyrate aminotransferase-like enzyme
VADAHGLWLIADESDIGWGATGHWLASEAWGAAPDCVILGAGLAGGLPLAAVGLRATVAERLPADWHAHPALRPPSLSPLLPAAALAVFDTIEQEGLLANAQQRGAQWERLLVTLQEDFDFIEAVRCHGTLSAIELDLPATLLQAALRKQGVLVDAVGETTLRVQLPLSLDEATLQQLAEAFHQACTAVERAPADA